MLTRVLKLTCCHYFTNAESLTIFEANSYVSLYEIIKIIWNKLNRKLKKLTRQLSLVPKYNNLLWYQPCFKFIKINLLNRYQVIVIVEYPS